MSQKYEDPSAISDYAIRKQYLISDEVLISARIFNYIKYRSISFGDLGWWLPLSRVLPIIGVTPQMLRPVFNPGRILEERIVESRVLRRFPFNFFEALGLIKREYRNEFKYESVEVELPEIIETYEQLGYFSLACEPFQELARILNKSIKAIREDGGTGSHYHLFTACPNGEILEATMA